MTRRSARNSCGAGVGALRRHRVAQRLGAGQLVQRGGQPRVHADQRAPVGLVLAVLVVVGRALGQRAASRASPAPAWPTSTARRRARAPRSGRSAAPSRSGARSAMRSVAAVTLGLPSRSPPIQLPMRKKLRDRVAGQRVLDLAVQARDLAQEGGVVVADSAFSISSATVSLAVRSMRVCHSCVTRARSSASLSARSRSVRSVVALRRPARRWRARRRGCSCAAPRSGGRSAPARCRRAAACARSSAARTSACGQPLEGHRQRAFLQVALALVVLAPAHVVAVLGDVGQVREVAEGADHADGLVARQVLQQPVERAAGLRRRA